jgi:hypothetical protein
MSTSYLRKYTDASAPQISSIAYGCLTTLLKTVLVDGYGAQAALGWTELYTSGDNYIKVFQGNGTGFPIRFDNSSAVGVGAGNYIEVSAYESMSDIDNGISRCPAVGNSCAMHICISSTLTSALPWMVIGDDKGFWFCVKSAHEQYPTTWGQAWNVFYFGDYVPVDTSNNHNLFICGYPVSETGIQTWKGTISRLYNQSNVAEEYWVLRDYDHEIGSVQAGIGPGTFYEYSSTLSNVGFGRYANVSPFSNERLFGVPTLHGEGGKLLGFLPGLLHPLLGYGDFNRGDLATFNDEEYILSDRTYHLLRIYFSSNTSSESYAYRPTSLCLVSGEGFRDVI